jgi:hypothetical protein
MVAEAMEVLRNPMTTTVMEVMAEMMTTTSNTVMRTLMTTKKLRIMVLRRLPPSQQRSRAQVAVTSQVRWCAQEPDSTLAIMAATFIVTAHLEPNADLLMVRFCVTGHKTNKPSSALLVVVQALLAVFTVNCGESYCSNRSGRIVHVE